MVHDIITWSNALLLLALASNLVACFYSLRMILSVRATAKRQTALGDELSSLHAQTQTARDLFLALCVQSVAAGAWPHTQVLGMLHAKAMANAALVGDMLKAKKEGQDD